MFMFMHVRVPCVCVICGVNKDTAVLPPVDRSKGMCMFMLHVCMCRRDLFMAVRLALAKLGAGAAAGGEDGDGRGMPVYGTGVTINTGAHQLGGGQSCRSPWCNRLPCGCIDLAVCSTQAVCFFGGGQAAGCHVGVWLRQLSFVQHTPECREAAVGREGGGL